MQGRYLLTDDWIVWSFVNIDLRPVSIVFRNVRVREDGFYRTLRHAGITINTSVGINVEAISQFMKCFDRADGRTIGIFAVNAQLNNYIGHWWNKLLSIMTNTYSVMSGMSTEKYQKGQLAGNIARVGVSNILIGFFFLGFTMRKTTLKTLIWISILLVAGIVIFRAGSFLSSTSLQQSTIPPLMESDDRQTEHHDTGCDPILIAIDADGNVYSGKNLIGSTTHPLNLTLKLKAEIEVRASRRAYTRGMDLNLELPSRCINVPVYVKSDANANESGIVALIRALRDIGVNPNRVVIPKARTVESRLTGDSHLELFS
jgi:hypothetical protein